jgi:hypothetical protein
MVRAIKITTYKQIKKFVLESHEYLVFKLLKMIYKYFIII